MEYFRSESHLKLKIDALPAEDACQKKEDENAAVAGDPQTASGVVISGTPKTNVSIKSVLIHCLNFNPLPKNYSNFQRSELGNKLDKDSYEHTSGSKTIVFATLYLTRLTLAWEKFKI